MSVNISRFDNELVISFDYSPSRVVKIKSIPGYKWNPEKKIWTVPYSDENLLQLKNCLGMSKRIWILKKMRKVQGL